MDSSHSYLWGSYFPPHPSYPVPQQGTGSSHPPLMTLPAVSENNVLSQHQQHHQQQQQYQQPYHFTHNPAISFHPRPPPRGFSQNHTNNTHLRHLSNSTVEQTPRAVNVIPPHQMIRPHSSNHHQQQQVQVHVLPLQKKHNSKHVPPFCNSTTKSKSSRKKKERNTKRLSKNEAMKYYATDGRQRKACKGEIPSFLRDTIIGANAAPGGVVTIVNGKIAAKSQLANRVRFSSPLSSLSSSN